MIHYLFGILIIFNEILKKIENMRKEITVIKNKGNFIDAIKKIDNTEIEIKKKLTRNLKRILIIFFQMQNHSTVIYLI